MNVRQTYYYRYFMITIGCIILAAGINLFFIPFKLLAGGLSAYCVLAYYLFGIPAGTLNLVANIPLFLAAYKLMSRHYFLSSLYGTIIFSVCFDGLVFLADLHVVHDILLSCFAGGVVTGIGSALIYRVGGSTGGTDIVGAIVQKHYTISISATNFISDIAMLLASCYFFGVEITLYTLLAYFVTFKTINVFMDGFDYKKSILIISQDSAVIGENIMSTVGRSVTYLKAVGGYTHNDLNAILVVAKLTQVSKIRSVVEKYDQHAFMIVQDARDVLGRGFTQEDKAIQRPILSTGWQEEDEDYEAAQSKSET